MRFGVQALNNRIRNIISILNRQDTSHDELKGSNRSRPEYASHREPSEAGGLGIDNLFRSEEELEAYAMVNEMKEKLEKANSELKDVTSKNDGLMRENGQMRVDMNRAVVELEELVKQLGELKTQVNHLQKENRALRREQTPDKMDSESQDDSDESDNSDWDEEGNRRSRGYRDSCSEMEEEASIIGASLADALQKYKVGAELVPVQNRPVTGENEPVKGRRIGAALGFIGLGRTRGTGQAAETKEHTDERHTSESDGEGSHHSQEGKHKGGMLGGLFGRADSERSNHDNSPEGPGDEAGTETPKTGRRGIFRALSRNNGQPNSNTGESSADVDSAAPRRKSFGLRAPNLRGRNASLTNKQKSPADLSQIGEQEE